MNHRILLTLFLIAICSNIYGQKMHYAPAGSIMISGNIINTPNGTFSWRNELFSGDTLDKVIVTAYYDCRFMTDTTTKTYTKYLADLEIGNYYSKFYAHKLYIIDSLCSSKEFLENKNATWIIADYYHNEYPWTFNNVIYIKNLDQNYKMSSRFIEVDYIHSGDIPEFHWTIHDSTKVIAGYTAQKATCSHNGFNYTAWFAPEIPISAGPWKFRGLPGLIISVKDSNEEYVYELRGLNTQERYIILPKYDYVEISEKKYTELRRLAIESEGFSETHTLSRQTTTRFLEPQIMKYRLQ